MDSQGRMVTNGLSLLSQQPGQYESTQDLLSLPAGAYLIELETAAGKTTKRVVLQR